MICDRKSTYHFLIKYNSFEEPGMNKFDSEEFVNYLRSCPDWTLIPGGGWEYEGEPAKNVCVWIKYKPGSRSTEVIIRKDGDSFSAPIVLYHKENMIDQVFGILEDLFEK